MKKSGNRLAASQHAIRAMGVQLLVGGAILLPLSAFAQNKTITANPVSPAGVPNPTTTQVNLQATSGGGYAYTNVTATTVDVLVNNTVSMSNGLADQGAAANYTVNNLANSSVRSTAANGSGIFLSSTGSGVSTVNNYGLIQGVTQGIYVSGSNAAVTNLSGGTIKATATNGILLARVGTVVNQSGASIAGGDAGDGVRIIGGTAAANSVANGGSITGGVSAVLLNQGGTVYNGSIDGGATMTAAIMSGGQNAVQLGVAGGTVNNYAGSRIISTGNDYSAVYIAAGSATVNNAGTIEATTGAGGMGVQTHSSVAGATVNNTGAINAALQGVVLNGGGTVHNGSLDAGSTTVTGAMISSVRSNAVQLGVAGGTVNNYEGNTIQSTAAGFAGILVSGGNANIGNIGTITGVNQAVRIGGTGTVTNYGGTIRGTSTAANFGIGVYFQNAGGEVINHAGASIIGDGNTGIYFAGVTGSGAADITNDGTVTGAVTGIQLGSNGSGDGGKIINTGTISGLSGTGSGVVMLGAGTADVTNAAGATISGNASGVQLGSSFGGGGGTVINSGTISGTNINGVSIFSGTATVTNDAGGSITGGANGIQFNTATNSDGLVENSGTITANTDAGVAMQNGGTVQNYVGGTIRNVAPSAGSGDQDGVAIQGAPGVVVNYGTISSAVGNGVKLIAGGTVTNNDASARILGQTTGIYLPNGGTVQNSLGLIEGTTVAGITGGNGVTVISSATIRGGVDAVHFVAGDNTLDLMADSVTVGNVTMGTGTDVTTVHQGADIVGVGTFDGRTAAATLVFDQYAGIANTIMNWQDVKVLDGADVTLDGAQYHQARLFTIDDSSRLGFSSQNGTLTGSVDNAGMLDYSAGAGSAAYAVTGVLTNSGTVRLAGQAGVAGNVLAMGSLVGQGGTFMMQTALGDDNSATDRLVINGGTATGNSFLDISNTIGTGAFTRGDGIMVVQAVNGATTESNSFQLAHRVAVGAVEYYLQYGGNAATGGDPGNQNWYLRNTLPPSPTPSPEPEPELPVIRVEVPVTTAVQPVALEYGFTLIGTMHERIGDTSPMPLSPAYEERQVWCKDASKNFRCTVRVPVASANDETRWARSGWARLIGERGNRDRNNFFHRGTDYSYTFGGIQAGLDIYARQQGDGTLDKAGFYVGYGQVDADVKGAFGGKAGSVDMDAYTLGGYWTHMSASRWYADAVLQGTFYSTSARSVLGQHVSPDGYGLVASLEGGYSHMLGNGWTLEPQAQLAYQVVSFDDARDQYGRFSFDNGESLRGRLGARLARTWDAGADPRAPQPVAVWVRANVWHEFLGDTKTRVSAPSGLNPLSFNTSLGGTWGEIGAGVTAQMSQAVSLFANGSYNRSLDNRGREVWGGRLGAAVRW